MNISPSIELDRAVDDADNLLCEHVGMGERHCCESPAHWRTTGGRHPYLRDDEPRFLCDAHASTLRRREVDRWLREIGARVIRVTPGRLARALDAHERGRRELFLRVLPGVEQERAPDGRLVGPILDALHLARLALGEG